MSQNVLGVNLDTHSGEERCLARARLLLRLNEVKRLANEQFADPRASLRAEVLLDLLECLLAEDFFISEDANLASQPD